MKGEVNFSEKELKQFCQENDISLLIFFGSAARGQISKNSDLDIAISFSDDDELDGNKPLYEVLAPLEAELAKIFTVPGIEGMLKIDLVLIDRAPPLLKYNIAQKGELFYEAEPGLYADFAVRAMKEHNDARKFYRFAEKNIENFLRSRENNDGKKVSPPKTQ